MDRVGGKAAGGGGERIAYVDAARGLAILCVVLGHLYPGDGIVQYISSFHVPVFFILSGLLMAAAGRMENPAPDGIRRQEGQAAAVPVCDDQRAESGADFRAQGAEGDAAPAHRDAPWRGN